MVLQVSVDRNSAWTTYCIIWPDVGREDLVSLPPTLVVFVKVPSVCFKCQARWAKNALHARGSHGSNEASVYTLLCIAR